jgi:hypothetical protein
MVLRPPGLPTPEGFAELAAPEKAHAMRELRTNPSTDPSTLQAVAWDTLADVFYGEEPPGRKLLSEARSTVQTIIDRQDEYAAGNPNLYFNSRLALIGYDVFRVQQEGGQPAELPEKSRLAMARQAGRLIQEFAAPVDFALNELDTRVNQKLLEAATIGMTALRTEAPLVTPVLAIPSMHDVIGIDPATNTSQFSMYLLQPGRALPLTVTKFVDDAMYDPTRKRGVLQIALAPLLGNTSNAISSLTEIRLTKGKASDGQLWLLGQVARHLAGFSTTGEVPRDYAKLMHLAARYIGLRTEGYDPEGLNAPVNDRARRTRPEE